MNLQAFGRNDGTPVFVMVSTILSTALNIFLDWLFVFPLKMGLAGAAIATGISQTVGLFIIAIHFLAKRGILRFDKFKYDGKLMAKVLKRGLPEMLSQLSAPISIFCMNLVILEFLGNDGVNAYSIIGYIVSFAVAVSFGVAEGVQPLFGQTYGNKNESDLKYYRRQGLLFGLIGSIVVYGLVVVLGKQICQLFGADQAATDMAIIAIPMYGWNFMFVALNTVISSYLYSTKRTKESVILNIIRGFVLTPLCVVALSFIIKGNIVWFTIGIAEVLSLIAALIIMQRSEKNGVNFNRK